MDNTIKFIKDNVPSDNFDLDKQYAKYTGILKGAQQGKVVTRFLPQPSGYLHIGHVKAALLNYHYATMYKGIASLQGKMLLRFDDTNPSKQKTQFVESIIQDLISLGVKWYGNITYTSDYFQLIFDYARKLIKKGLAYCDDTAVQEMRKQRTNKQESKYRNTSVQQNQKLFQLMVKGKEDNFCLRAKIDMNSNNGCLRDPVIMRQNWIIEHIKFLITGLVLSTLYTQFMILPVQLLIVMRVQLMPSGQVSMQIVSPNIIGSSMHQN